MQIFVQMSTGKTNTLNVEPDDTINTVKSIIHNTEGIPKAQQRLTFQGLLVEDTTSLQDAGIKHESTLHLDVQGSGGMGSCSV